MVDTTQRVERRALPGADETHLERDLAASSPHHDAERALILWTLFTAAVCEGLLLLMRGCGGFSGHFGRSGGVCEAAAGRFRTEYFTIVTCDRRARLVWRHGARAASQLPGDFAFDGPTELSAASTMIPLAPCCLSFFSLSTLFLYYIRQVTCKIQHAFDDQTASLEDRSRSRLDRADVEDCGSEEGVCAAAKKAERLFSRGVDTNCSRRQRPQQTTATQHGAFS
jgi:hypothetical protein